MVARTKLAAILGVALLVPTIPFNLLYANQPTHTIELQSNLTDSYQSEELGAGQSLVSRAQVRENRRYSEEIEISPDTNATGGPLPAYPDSFPDVGPDNDYERFTVVDGDRYIVVTLDYWEERIEGPDPVVFVSARDITDETRHEWESLSPRSQAAIERARQNGGTAEVYFALPALSGENVIVEDGREQVVGVSGTDSLGSPVLWLTGIVLPVPYLTQYVRRRSGRASYGVVASTIGAVAVVVSVRILARPPSPFDPVKKYQVVDNLRLVLLVGVLAAVVAVLTLRLQFKRD